ncbi:L-dopachrome tautomerase-related protein [Massilia sp. METH4]|uniref:L-dopachrome tautomerase-related protein n=1 Tax=Massilia sp. METH4 TaxID=3123041 RepID=UPI0030D3C06C
MRLNHKHLALAGLFILGLHVAHATPLPGKTMPAFPQGPVKIEQLAYFPEQQITGIAVSRSGRVFVTAPRLSVEVPVSVGEVIDGKIVPYPGAGWNAYRNDGGARNDPKSQFVSAQAAVMDHRDNLWIVDAATPNVTGPVQGGVKLVRIDVKTNTVAQVVHLDGETTPPGSSINDVRFSPDDRFAYLSDVGGRGGALVVVNLETGKSWRVLDGHPSTQADPSVELMADGKPLRTPDGRKMNIAVNGVAISPDGATFYWQALTGKTLYSLPTAVLQDPARAAKAEPVVVATTHPACGLWIDAAGRFFMANPAESSVEVADSVGAPLRTLVKDERMRWPDSFAQDTSGNLYISANFIQDSPWFKKGVTKTPGAIFKISPR